MRALMVGALIVLGTASAVWAQEGPEPRGRQGRLAPNEVGRLFEAYAVVQAQETLGLDDEQYARFLPRFRSLMRTRRAYEVARAQILVELAALSRSGARAADEQALRDRLKALDEAEASGRTQVAAAVAAVDEVLTLQQRARFRVFEEQMERKKFELMTRARQSVRPLPRRQPQPQ
jgi:hypothetical protein